MLRRLLGRVYLDRVSGRLWLYGSWHPIYRLNDGYICHNLSVEQLSSIRMEDLPRDLLIKDIIPVGLSSTRAALYMRSGRINVNVEVSWPYAVGREEFEERLTHMLRNLGYEVRLYRGEGGVGAAITCSGKLSPYLEDLVMGLEGFTSWVSELHKSRIQEARRILDRLSQIAGRSLAALKGLSGVARMLVASLTRDDIAHLLLGSDEVNSHVKSIVFKEMGLDEGGVYGRLRVLGLYRRAGEGLQASWPLPLVRKLTEDLYSSWVGGGPAVSQHLNAHHLMACIYRNLYPLIVRDSLHGGDVGWRYGLRKSLGERLYPSLTFIDVAVTSSLCLGVQPPLYRLRESLNTLKNLGILSEDLKPRPYAVNITRLVRGYMAKTGLVKKPRERREWENMLGWGTLTNLDQSMEIM